MDKKELEIVAENYNKSAFDKIINNEENNFIYKTLLENECIRMQTNGKIKKMKQNKIYVGKLRVKKSFGFVTTKDGDFFVKNVENNIDGDEVLIIHIDSEKSKNNDEAKILELIERPNNELIIRVNKRLKCIIPNENEFSNYSVKVKDENLIKYANTYVKIKINKVENFQIEGSILDLIADKNDPDLQMKLVLATFGIESDFKKEDLETAKKIANTQIEMESDRIDLRNQMFFTIDGSDAKDLDDAVSLFKEGENYRLFVSIADVSYYINEGSVLDNVAKSRSTSVYFIDRVVPMLPKDISNGICSLHPNVNRYTLTCEMLINKIGNVVEHKIYPSIINSKYKMTYSDVNDMIINNDSKLISKYSDIYAILKEMNKLAKTLNKKRLIRGSFNFEDKEPVFKLDDNNDIIDISVRQRYDAEKLIEEFMIVANETVAEAISHMDLPFVYRVHGQPIEKKLFDLRKVFPLFGVVLKGSEQDFHASSFKNALDEVEDSLSKRILSDMIIRSLQKAYYSTNNIGHFGLASTYYTHFTSPIRRYPDLIVHRMIRRYIFDSNFNNIESVQGNLDLISSIASDKEVKAIKAEQLIEDKKKAEYMKQFVNKEYDGVVSSMTDYGFFVELDNTIRGLIRYRQLEDFVEAKNFTIILKRKEQIKVGQIIKVRLVGVNIERGLVDFEPVDYRVKKEQNESYRTKQKSKVRLSNSKSNGSRNRTKRKRNKSNKRGKSKP